MSRALYADAPPNFTLTWELTGKDRETHHDKEWYHFEDHKDKEWYHIDDHKLTTPRPPPCPPEEMHLSGNLYVPYSHSRTRRSIESRGLEIDAETTGLGSHAATIVDALNNLYSVPADARLPLCFEPLSLRRMKITGELDEYLIKATQFLKDLRQASGTFIIWDYDTLGNHFCYYPSDLSWNIEDEQQFRLLVRRRMRQLFMENGSIDRYYKLIPRSIYRGYFTLMKGRKHWQATDWAACSQEWLHVRAHLSSQGYLGFNEPQTIRYVVATNDNHDSEEKQDRGNKIKTTTSLLHTNLTPCFQALVSYNRRQWT